MTNIEAIEWIKNHLCPDSETSNTDHNNAMRLAISALESIDRIKAERDAAINDLKNVHAPYGICYLCAHDNERMQFDCVHLCRRAVSHCLEVSYETASDCWEWKGIKG